MKSDLARELDEAVASALAEAGRTAAWRTYNGPKQASLTEHLRDVTGCANIGLASSGSAALEMILRAFRLPPGSEVLLAGYDYPGNFAAVERAGARPALVDVEKASWNLAIESLNAVVSPNCRALIVSHLHGQLQPIAHLHQWCRERKIRLIQDACQALGATIEGRVIGELGDATVFSFGGSKVISGGRGGAWATNDPELAQHSRLAAGVGSGPYELSELQATAILAQLPFLDRITARCRAYFRHQASVLAATCPELSAPWLADLNQTAFYQAGWILPDALSANSLMELSQSQHAEHEHIGIGSGFPGYHRRSPRRCRIDSPLRNTPSIARTTLTVHYRAALSDLPVAEVIAKLVNALCK